LIHDSASEFEGDFDVEEGTLLVDVEYTNGVVVLSDFTPGNLLAGDVDCDGDVSFDDIEAGSREFQEAVGRFRS